MENPKVSVVINAENAADLAVQVKELARQFGVTVPVTQEDIKETTKKAPVKEKETKAKSLYTADRIREKVSEVVAADEANKPKVKKLLTKLGASNVSALDESKYDEFMEALKEFEEEL